MVGGNSIARINKVITVGLRQTTLVLRWVIVCGHTVGNQPVGTRQPALLPLVGALASRQCAHQRKCVCGEWRRSGPPL